MASTLDDPLNALKRYVSHASVSADSKFSKGVAGAKDFVSDLLTELGFAVDLIETPINPVILATRGDPAWPKLVIYGHYEVQPPDPCDLWDHDPFDAVELNGRLFGRGAADNKGPQIVHMAALHNVLKKYPNLPIHITYLIEGLSLIHI